MSAVKRMIESVLEMYSEGVPMVVIAERLRVPIDVVENILEEHTNFYDY
jgi:hypothetical protein